MDYGVFFYCVGVVSTILFTLLGMSIFAALVMNLVWRKFKD